MTAVSPQSCVVIGDSDAAAREQVVHVLEGMGFDVRQAGTGVEALRLVRSGRPSAVLLDVALPEISGYQVCHMLRGEYGSDLPIVLLSSNRVESYDKTAGLLLGATDYLEKPFSPDELLARLKAHMRPSAAQKRNGSDGDTLTPSELRVLRMLASGVHTKVIAHELAITPKTVSVHIQNAMKKNDQQAGKPAGGGSDQKLDEKNLQQMAKDLNFIFLVHNLQTIAYSNSTHGLVDQTLPDGSPKQITIVPTLQAAWKS